MLIDLTMPISEDTASDPSHGRTPVFLTGTIAHDRPYPELGPRNPYDGSRVSFANAGIYMCDHTGTHIDAPLHADPDGQPVDALPLEYCFGPAVWLDLSEHCADHGELDAGHLEAAERRGGERIRDGDILLLWTGWSTVLPDKQRYVMNHPGITQEAGEWIRSRGVRTLGIDTTTPDTLSNDLPAPVHANFLKPASIRPVVSNAPVIGIIENVVNINRIPSRRFRFCGLPLPLVGLTGSPLRAVAEV
ncbi:MAG: cyclase family protein [Actinomycetota bacterium]|nr:cyclase family protein [Actinomycetota bacterium]